MKFVKKPNEYKHWKPVMKATSEYPQKFRVMVFYYKMFHYNMAITKCICNIKENIERLEKEEAMFRRWKKEYADEIEGKICPFCLYEMVEHGDCCNGCSSIFSRIE